MAVYTPLEVGELRLWAQRFALGRLLEHRGIAAGTVNTIYKLKTSRGVFVLRLLEDRSLRAARFEASLIAHLLRKPSVADLMVALEPERDTGALVLTRRPRQQVSMFRWLAGRPLRKKEIEPEHAAAIGAFLGRFHGAQRGFRGRRRCDFDPQHMRAMLRAGWPRLPSELQSPLQPVRRVLERASWSTAIPWGIAHGDLFADNAHFSRGKLVGVLDFEMASRAPLLYDVAVALCEWGFDDDGTPLEAHIRALFAAYQGERTLDAGEEPALFGLCLYATARFTWTRVRDFVLSEREASVRRVKDYREFLRRHRALEALGAAGLAAMLKAPR